MSASKLLVVDDERNVRYSLEKSLSSEQLTVLTASCAREAFVAIEREKPDVVILDVRLPDMSGLDAFDQIRRTDPKLPVIIITAFGSMETAIEAMKRGAFEYLLKPTDLDELRRTVERAAEQSRLSRVPALFDPDGHLAERDDASFDLIVGRSAPMQEIFKEIGRVARQDVNVLVLGESGTGKELVTRAIYQHSRRGERPFLAINCAAIPEALLESELFGHERGAFTGADRRRIGSFEQADGGTVFLDEIGDMTLATQAKVLRLLQDGRFQRVGGSETITTDVRVVAATNQDLEQLIGQGKFREDLYYRLKVFTIHLPPLRERMDDLPLLIEHFLRRFRVSLGKDVRRLAPEAMELLRRHRWPGNVRELQGALQHACVRASGQIITPDCLPESLRRQPLERAEEATAAAEEEEGKEPPLDIAALVRRWLDEDGQLPDIYRRVIERVDRIVLDEVLRHTGGNQVTASRLLGISRTTLRTKLQTGREEEG